jgi:hypothetical protein
MTGICKSSLSMRYVFCFFQLRIRMFGIYQASGQIQDNAI